MDYTLWMQILNCWQYFTSNLSDWFNTLWWTMVLVFKILRHVLTFHQLHDAMEVVIISFLFFFVIMMFKNVGMIYVLGHQKLMQTFKILLFSKIIIVLHVSILICIQFVRKSLNTTYIHSSLPSRTNFFLVNNFKFFSLFIIDSIKNLSYSQVNFLSLCFFNTWHHRCFNYTVFLWTHCNFLAWVKINCIYIYFRNFWPWIFSSFICASLRFFTLGF